MVAPNLPGAPGSLRRRLSLAYASAVQVALVAAGAVVGFLLGLWTVWVLPVPVVLAGGFAVAARTFGGRWLGPLLWGAVGGLFLVVLLVHRAFVTGGL